MMPSLFADYCPQWEIKILSWLEEEVGFEHFQPGLQRLQFYLKELRARLEKSPTKIVTVAGTNGKGETCHALAAILEKQRVTYALWTSPHILSIRERFVVNGQMISYERLWQGMKELELRRNKALVPLSFYEFLLVLFMEWAMEHAPAVLILEVGLGGRWDGVNFFSAQLVGLTSISRDHQEILGKTFALILREKLGVTRRGAKLISALELDYLRHLVREHCEQEEVQWQDLFAQKKLHASVPYSVRNRRLALHLASHLEVGISACEKHLKALPMSFKGRSEKVTIRGQRFIFVGAHNLDGLRKLLDAWEEEKEGDVWGLLAFSKRDHKDVRGMLQALANSVFRGRLWLSHFQHPKALKKEELLHLLSLEKESGVNYTLDWKELIACEKYLSSTFLVAGSYYFIGEVQRHLIQVHAALGADVPGAHAFPSDTVSG